MWEGGKIRKTRWERIEKTESIDIPRTLLSVKPNVLRHSHELSVACLVVYKLSHSMSKPTKWHAGLAKTQISLHICPVWSESLLCAQWVAKEPNFLPADSEDSDQTGWMPRLIMSLRWVHISICWFCHAAAQFVSYKFMKLCFLSHDGEVWALLLCWTLFVMVLLNSGLMH